jgi:biopolymer transport protein ExbD
MRLRTRTLTRGHLGELPLTSLIDVVFLLLIYFLVTLSMRVGESSLSSTLKTESKGAGQAADLQPQIIHVELGADRKGVFRLGQRVFPTVEGLRGVLAQLPKEAGVIVRVRGEAPVASAAAAVQACKDAGFARISYVPAE